MFKTIQSIKKSVFMALGLLLCLQLQAGSQQTLSWGRYFRPQQQPMLPQQPLQTDPAVPLAGATSQSLAGVGTANIVDEVSPTAKSTQVTALPAQPEPSAQPQIPALAAQSWQKPMPTTYEELEPTRAPVAVEQPSRLGNVLSSWRAGSRPIAQEPDEYDLYRQDLKAERKQARAERAAKLEKDRAELQAWAATYEKDLAAEQRDRALLYERRFETQVPKSRYDQMLAEQEQQLVVSQAAEMLYSLNKKEAAAHAVIAQNSGMFSNLFASPAEQLMRSKRVEKAKADLNIILRTKEELDFALENSDSIEEQLAELEYLQQKIESQPGEFNFARLEELDRAAAAEQQAEPNNDFPNLGAKIEARYPKAGLLAAIMASGIDEYLRKEEDAARAEAAAGKSDARLNEILGYKAELAKALNQDEEGDQLDMLQSLAEKKINLYKEARKRGAAEQQAEPNNDFPNLGAKIEARYPKAGLLAAIIASGIDEYLRKEEDAARAEAAAGKSDARLNEILGYKAELAKALNQDEEGDQLDMLQSLAEKKIDLYKEARKRGAAEQQAEPNNDFPNLGAKIEARYPKAGSLAAIIASGIDEYLRKEEDAARAEAAAGKSDARLNEILGYKAELAKALNQDEEGDQLNMLQSLAEKKIDPYKEARKRGAAEQQAEQPELNLLEPMAPGEGESMPVRAQVPPQEGQKRRDADLLQEQEQMLAEQKAAAARERAAQEFGNALIETRAPQAESTGEHLSRSEAAFGQEGKGAEQPELATIPEPTVGSEQPVASTEPFITPEEGEGEEYKQADQEAAAQALAQQTTTREPKAVKRQGQEKRGTYEPEIKEQESMWERFKNWWNPAAIPTEQEIGTKEAMHPASLTEEQKIAPEESAPVPPGEPESTQQEKLPAPQPTEEIEAEQVGSEPVRSGTLAEFLQDEEGFKKAQKAAQRKETPIPVLPTPPTPRVVNPEGKSVGQWLEEGRQRTREEQAITAEQQQPVEIKPVAEQPSGLEQGESVEQTVASYPGRLLPENRGPGYRGRD